MVLAARVRLQCLVVVMMNDELLHDTENSRSFPVGENILLYHYLTRRVFDIAFVSFK